MSPITSIWNFQNRQIDRHMTSISGCLGLEGRRLGDLLTQGAGFAQVMKTSKVVSGERGTAPRMH